MSHCSICDKHIIGTGWFCNECAKTYELTKTKYKQWPDWVTFLVRCERKERHKEKIEQEFGVIGYGVSIDDLSEKIIQ